MSDNSVGSGGVMPKLSIMMFLQFFIWGSWYTSVSTFMAANGMQEGIYWVFTAGPLGAIFAPFLVGLIADRFINTEKMLGILFVLGSIPLFILPNLADKADSSMINTCIMIHMLLYMPTLALSASLSFAHMTDQVKQFPLVRVWGTIGWIVAGIAISSLDLEKTATQFYLAGGACVLLGLFSFGLPSTPAPKKGQPVSTADLFFKDSWALFKKPSFAVFIVCSFLICIPLAAYYAFLQIQMGAMGIENTAGAKTIGQGSEVVFMFLMPFFFRRLGVKKMIAIGVLAWVARYAMFALGATEDMVFLVYAGIFLHGICYDFFFVTGQVYVDQATSTDIRAQAQSMNVFFTQGLGMYLGAIISGMMFNNAFANPNNSEKPLTAGDATNLPLWADFWWPLCGMAVVILIIFLVAFKHKDVEGAEISH